MPEKCRCEKELDIEKGSEINRRGYSIRINLSILKLDK
jgi:hypothetical protein